ncbi:hypothetical protein FKW77_001334 [Venturia effusa]|uniref:Uncharacterized protein n=1 Tax=Venturia effusa TaxID=50376 RepID=A0A517LAC7_9PEZI|nr:hypothetical protein FKW77_001334 [Venturia effusa]
MGQFLSKSNQSPSQPPADEKDREIARLREQVEAQQRDLWACNAHIRYLEQDLDNERQMNDDAEMRRQDSYDRAATRTDEREERGGDQHQQQQQQQQQQAVSDSAHLPKAHKLTILIRR